MTKLKQVAAAVVASIAVAGGIGAWIVMPYRVTILEEANREYRQDVKELKAFMFRMEERERLRDLGRLSVPKVLPDRL